MSLRLTAPLVFLAAIAGCHPGGGPQLKVIGVHDTAAHEVVFVQVTNPASHAMRLTRLEYTFAADGATISQGEVTLARDVQPGAAVVVEVPYDGPAAPDGGGAPAMTLQGTLTTQLDRIVRTFPVSAAVAAQVSGK